MSLMAKFLTFFLVVLTTGILLPSCTKKTYNPQANVKHTSVDSLMVDLAIFMGKRPKGVRIAACHNPKYRQYYTELSAEFYLLYYHVTSDGYHYFYALRPARNHTGKVNRAVGGRFTLNNEGHIIRFEELFNTRILPKTELEQVGLELFKEMIQTGGIQKYIKNRQLIEWPDSKTVYDTELNEWVYLND